MAFILKAFFYKDFRGISEQLVLVLCAFCHVGIRFVFLMLLMHFGDLLWKLIKVDSNFYCAHASSLHEDKWLLLYIVTH